MDIKPQTTQSTSDDQELAKVLAGVSDDAGVSDGAQVTGMTPPPMPEPTAPPPAAEPDVQAVATEAPVATAPEIPAMPEVPDSFAAPSPADSSLDTVKKDAINELRPLVDKLNISAEEKFDTYLLLIRSTDDKTLVAPAHEAAKEIADEARRAQALLDIIKEIDFLTNPQQQQ